MTTRFSIASGQDAPGVKRGAGGNNDARLDMDRPGADPPTPPVTPARLTPGVSSSNARHGAASAMVDLSDSAHRLSHTEVARRKSGCGADVAEMCSPRRVLMLDGR